MSISSSNWIAYQESSFEHERVGLDRIRQALPADTVLGAWSNFTLFEPSGRMHEVDALVLTRFGLWLLELKHWYGQLVVDQGYIISQRRANVRASTERNPILRTRTKAQVLASLLRSRGNYTQGEPVPHVAPVVVITHPQAELRFAPGSERLAVVTVDQLPTIIGRAAPDHRRPEAAQLSEAQLSRLREGLSQLDFAKGAAPTRRAFSYNLRELLEESDDYQDYLGEHTDVAGKRARIRLFFGRDPVGQQLAREKAEREFLLLEEVAHPGILAPLNLEETAEGTALLYPFLANAAPLSHWLTSGGNLLALPLELRIVLWRQVGEALRYAHQRKLLHRALAPGNLLATLDEQERPTSLKIMNWHTGRGETVRGATQHLSAVIEKDEALDLFVAPELYHTEQHTPILDIYSLGALGYLFLTGQEQLDDLRFPEEVPESLRALIRQMMHEDPAQRTATTEDFLRALDEKATPQPALPAAQWLPVRRLGEGGSSQVFLAQHASSGLQGALKVAREPRFDDIISAEADVLRQFRHPHVVELLDVLEMNGRKALVTSFAGSTTLAGVLQSEGPFQAERLGQVSSLLFDVAQELESQALYYCDWKPANVGWDGERFRIFDFSVATRTPQTAKVGTPAYRDPMLLNRPRWDWWAERYALAMTLCEVATGELPTGEPLLLPPAIKGTALEAFLRKALAPVLETRHQSLPEMRGDWERALSGLQPAATTHSSFTVEVQHAQVVSLAMQHNAVPVVHSFKVVYEGDRALRGVKLCLRLGDEFSEVTELARESWTPGESWEKHTPPLWLRAQQLVSTIETAKSYLALEIYEGEQRLHQHLEEIDVLAYNHWAGLRSLPELLCSFVLPNHPSVQQVLSQSRSALERLGGDVVLNGYQSGSVNSAYTQVQAIYRAISELQIQYLQGSFGLIESGQKIRTPDQLLEHRQGNCLDLTCLFAACLRQVGLNPILVLVQGHAFPGCWLREEDDPNGHIEDPATLQKAIGLGILCVFDAVSACSTPGLPYSEAEAGAKGYLEDDGQFLIALDLRSAERSNIRALPLRFTSQGQVSLIESEVRKPEDSAYTQARTWTAPKAAPVKSRETWERRLSSWKNRLLDLSTRNRLLDVRKDSNKRILPLLLEKPQEILDALLGGSEFTLVGRPSLLREDDPRSRQLAQLQTKSDPVQAEVQRQFQSGRLCINLDDNDLTKRSVELYRAERVNVEETGSSTLYLALGLLSWLETDKATGKRHAPIALLPVQLVRTRVNEPYKLRARDEDLRINLTLLRKLAADFKIDLSAVEQWPGEDETPNLLGLLQHLRSELLNMTGWNIYDQAVIGSFSFSKLLMLQDLERFPTLQDSSPMLKRFLQQNYQQSKPLLEPAQVETRSSQDSHCVLDADSSQMAAVFSSEQGNSFVLQGPPGTGKSQTITNMIAQNLARGRTVLFVAEKMAALEVVYRRLQKVGLAPFCLQLHSNKASKSEVVQQLAESLVQRGNQLPEQRGSVAQRLGEQQKQLSEYVQSIHQRYPVGHSLFSAISRIAELAREAPFVELHAGASLKREDIETGLEVARDLRARLRDVGAPAQNIWNQCQVRRWTREEAVARFGRALEGHM